MSKTFSTREIYNMGATPSAALRAVGCVVDAYVCTASGHSDPLAYEDGEEWYENTSRAVLNWLGGGKDASVRSFCTGIRRLIGAQSACVDWLDGLSPSQRAVVRASALGDFLASYESTFNHARFADLLSGQKRTRWRKALVEFFVRDRPLSAHDLIPSVFDHSNTANHALNSLELAGLLQSGRCTAGGRKHYTLTLDGQAAAGIAFKVDAEEARHRARPAVTLPDDSSDADNEHMMAQVGIDFGEEHKRELQQVMNSSPFKIVRVEAIAAAAA